MSSHPSDSAAPTEHSEAPQPEATEPSPGEGAGPVPARTRRILRRPSLVILAVLALGLVGVASLGKSRSGSTRRRNPAARAVRPPAPPPPRPFVGPLKDPEMPTLMAGPPAPEDLGIVRGGPGLEYHGPPLMPVPGSLPMEALSPGPAVPLDVAPRAIVPRGSAGDTGASAPERPARSAETSSQKPLRLRLQATRAAESAYGTGNWLNIRASGSVPCYLMLLQVDAQGRASILFPRRVDLSYRPNVSYRMAARSAAGDQGEYLIAVASVYPLTAADALAALEARAPSVETAEGAPPLSAALDAAKSALRARADGSSTLGQWEAHAWTVTAAFHPSPEPAAAPARREPGGGDASPDRAPGQPAAPAPR